MPHRVRWDLSRMKMWESMSWNVDVGKSELWGSIVLCQVLVKVTNIGCIIIRDIMID